MPGAPSSFLFNSSGLSPILLRTKSEFHVFAPVQRDIDDKTVPSFIVELSRLEAMAASMTSDCAIHGLTPESL